MFKRLLLLSKIPERSFFLWGPRQVGKSTLLKSSFPKALLIDLLKSEEFIRFQERPSILREISGKNPPVLTIIDEVQKVPLLLDEVHWLIENRKQVFGLCGSSARRLKRGGANLLGGRALRHIMLGLSVRELGDNFDLLRLINQGNLPNHYLCESSDWLALVRAYVADYLKEEIAAEAAVKNLPAFSAFLSAAALSDSEPVNFSRFGSDVGVSGHTIKEYFEILVDTYQGAWLPAYSKRPKRRTRETPKFYFDNVGTVNFLAKRGTISEGSELFGKAFENLIFHELRCYIEYRKPDVEIAYWALTSQTEVDFVIGQMDVVIEAKGTARLRPDHLKGLREVRREYPGVGKRIVVSLESHERVIEDGIMVVPVKVFLERLWEGEIF